MNVTHTFTIEPTEIYVFRLLGSVYTLSAGEDDSRPTVIRIKIPAADEAEAESILSQALEDLTNSIIVDKKKLGYDAKLLALGWEHEKKEKIDKKKIEKERLRLKAQEPSMVKKLVKWWNSPAF